MKAFIMKADNDYWYEIKSFNSMKDVYNLMEEYDCGIIVEKNYLTSDDDFDFWEGMKAEDIPVIKACPLLITLCNHYVAVM